MAKNTTLCRIDGDRVTDSLQDALGTLPKSGEMLLDLSSVERIDAGGVRALARITARATERQVRVTARGVKVDVYRVLKLARAIDGLSFMS